MNNEIFKLDRTINTIAIAILAVGALAVCLFPWIFSQHSSGIDFSTTGEIGDTIGGITAPVIGLVSAALIYLSFLAQRQANKLQWDAIQNELLINNIERIHQQLLAQSDLLNKRDMEVYINRFITQSKMPKGTALFDFESELTNRIILYIENYCFLFNRFHQSSLDITLKENFRLSLRNENIKFQNLFASVKEHIPLYSTNVENQIIKLHNSSLYKRFVENINAFVQNAEYLNKLNYFELKNK